MGGWIQTAKTMFIHQEDRCPSNTNESTYICSSYDSNTSAVSQCAGHRNVNNRDLNFQAYGLGSVIHHDQPNSLRDELKKELGERRNHVWYRGLASEPASNPVGHTPLELSNLIEHSQENVLNSCIAALNSIINSSNDYIQPKDNTVLAHAVASGNVLSAENLKYLERNVLNSYRDCICYSDCTAHGLSSWVERTWCETYGGHGY